jgi:Tat protein secretion system quality control protein TatD with DNase activity
VAEKMAEIKGVSPQEMIDIAAENARKLFRIP